MTIKSRLSIIFAMLWLCALSASAQGHVRFHDEARDTVRINDMLSSVAARHLPVGDAVVALGELLIDTPYRGHTLEGPVEMLTVNLDSLDCTTFVETVMALALTLDEHRQSWRDYVYNLQRLRYRGGQVNGYPSRLHYICDWAVDNIHRGNFRDATPDFDRVAYITRSIDFMSDNASKYTALADSANLAGIKNVENGYRNYRFPYIKTVDLGSKAVKGEWRNGDILAFVTNIKNLDIAHMGILVLRDGEPYVMHASSSGGRVMVSQQPLPEFMKKNRQFLGVRVFRL